MSQFKILARTKWFTTTFYQSKSLRSYFFIFTRIIKTTSDFQLLTIFTSIKELHLCQCNFSTLFFFSSLSPFKFPHSKIIDRPWNLYVFVIIIDSTRNNTRLFTCRGEGGWLAQTQHLVVLTKNYSEYNLRIYVSL